MTEVIIKQEFIKDQARLGILKTTYCQKMNKHTFLFLLPLLTPRPKVN